jgi:DnaB helicase-like protein/Toprim domain-containing protein
MSITDKIQSMQSQVNATYRKPSVEKMESMQSSLLSSDVALDYLRISRNLTDETIKNFGLGYDSDKNAIAIPVYKRGELINIRYRFLEPTGSKYTQEKDCEVWIYNEDGIQAGVKKGGILIVEGEFDLMSAHQAGFKNIISPASGKDSYGVWLELIDNLPKVYISYDNDKPGKDAALRMAERIGTDKCFEVIYPEGIKDANDYFKKYTTDDYRDLIKTSKPYYSYQFKGMRDIIEDLRFNKQEVITSPFLPDVRMGQDWLTVISGVSNIGKTSVVMNIAMDLTAKDIPVLVLPFERGNQVVGTRFLQVKYNLGEGDFGGVDDDMWQKITKECLGLPLYFSMPSKDETIDIIKKSKRFFNTRVVIIDHLDYMIRSSQNKEAEIGNTLQGLKRIAEEFKIAIIIVTHVRKIQQMGAATRKKPGIEDLKGSSSLYQDPECVVMLTSPETGVLEVDVVKNKGKMSNKMYHFNQETGRIGDEFIPQISKKDKDFENF